MGETTRISWCHHTWSPWMGCAKVSAGCKNCYAEALAERFAWPWGGMPREKYAEAHWREPHKWNRKAERAAEVRRVFPSTMDPFEDRPEIRTTRLRFFHMIGQTPWLEWLLLTKRPENILRLWPVATSDEGTSSYMHFPNVRLMVSVEDQPAADIRIPRLLDAAVQLGCRAGLSCEPLIGPVDLSRALYIGPEGGWEYHGAPRNLIDWVIVGGESGPHRRAMLIEWAEAIRDQCAAAGVAFFMKQDAALHPGQRGRCPDAIWLHQFPESPLPQTRAPWVEGARKEVTHP